MARIWASLGSNVERETNIRGAVAALRERFGELVVSRVYESAAVGFSGEPFYNLVAGFDSDLPCQEIMRIFREVEAEFGRVRGGAKFSSRTLDIDLLTYGDLVTRGEGYALPREEIESYSFVLCPLAEVAPQQLHPVSGKSFARMWSEFDATDQSLAPVEFDFNTG
ncbi:MAG: 2-amino-4-hydroxy-6-hydroxymethyldihydropteridine diphosphokinase [Sedimenticola sp.]|nr:MAG: 2-amino-4-hydroxy-6-hydroxymethyldihydropteridine diphosphokinase [Sedimenticola sp.]